MSPEKYPESNHDHGLWAQPMNIPKYMGCLRNHCRKEFFAAIAIVAYHTAAVVAKYMATVVASRFNQMDGLMMRRPRMLYAQAIGNGMLILVSACRYPCKSS